MKNCDHRSSDQNATKRGKRVSLPVMADAAPGASRIKASRAGRWRAVVLIGVNLLMIAHFAHWWFGGRTLTPVEPSETIFTLRDGMVNAGFVFFTSALLITLFAGRWVCGWLCHIVSLQDFCGWLMKKVGIKPKPFRSRLLMFVPLLAACYMFVWPVVARLLQPAPHNQAPTLHAEFMTEHYWDTFPPWWLAIPFLGICTFGVVYFLGAKGYCTYACPYGGFFGLLDNVAVGRIRVTDACEQCGHCTAVCTSNVQVHREVKDYGMVVDPGCMKCLDCVSVCPNEALYFGLGLPGVARQLRTEKPSRVAFPLTWVEEIAAAVLFAVSLMCIYGVYDSCPFLMALGCAGIVTFLTIKSWSLLKHRDVTIQNLRLKSGGRVNASGIIALMMTALLWALTAHCGFIRWNEFRAGRAYQSAAAHVNFNLDPFFAGVVAFDSQPTPFRESVLSGIETFEVCQRHGLMRAVPTEWYLGQLEMFRGNRERALELMRSAREHAPRKALGDINYYIGGIELALGEVEKGIASLQAATREEKYHANAYIKLGSVLAMTDRLGDAIEAWKALTRCEEQFGAVPQIAVGYHNLGGAMFQRGRLDDAAWNLEQAVRLNPSDAQTFMLLGQVYSQMGRSMEASRCFERAVQINPAYREMLQTGG